VDLLTSSKTVVVAAPLISLQGTLSAIAPKVLKAGKAASLTLTLTNLGNIDATGPASVAIGLSTDGSTVSESITTVSIRSLRVKAGGKQKVLVHLHFKLPTDLQAISYDPIVTLTQGSNSLTVVGSPFTPAGSSGN
jgi:hypothetical protein